MKLAKVLEIKDRCKQCSKSLEVEKAHPEWHDCSNCPLNRRIEIKAEIDPRSTENGFDGATITVQACLILETIAGAVKAKRR